MGIIIASIEYGSELGVMTAANTEMHTIAYRRHARSFALDSTPASPRKIEQDGELEREPEREGHQHHEAQ